MGKYITLDRAIEITESTLSILKRIRDGGGHCYIGQIAKEIGLSETQVVGRIQNISKIDDKECRVQQACDVRPEYFSPEERLYAEVFERPLPLVGELIPSIVYEEYESVSYENALEAISTLGSGREMNIVKKYLGFECDRCETLYEIGKEYGITVERVRQIYHKAIRKLRHPSRKMIILNDDKEGWESIVKKYTLGAQNYDAMQQEIERLKESNDLLFQENEEIKGFIAGEATRCRKIAEVEKDLSKIPLEHLNLSVRSFNGLKRAGFDTAGDVAKLTEDELYRIRSLGRKSCDEILGVMRKYIRWGEEK